MACGEDEIGEDADGLGKVERSRGATTMVLQEKGERGGREWEGKSAWVEECEM